ncbi:hypothetical protein [Bacillus pinisoli]|uniref:hypothetical protein n=1 Tax=Bacillus pinisoli TaxID=2901866 RepID=UPI001FF5E5F9|nr:hypothetical protein [Bacillus pinisoli]
MKLLIYSILIVTLLVLILRKNYFQKWNVPIIEEAQFKGPMVLLDVRDYNDSYHSPVKGAVNIPIAYLRRYYEEIPKHNILLIVSNHIEKKAGIRCLRRKGFEVIGYKVIQPNTDINYLIFSKEDEIWNTMTK